MIAQTVRLTMFIVFLVAIGFLAVFLKIADLVRSRPIDRTPWAQRCFRGATGCLGLNVTCHGQPASSPTLYVCNHVSWCDIPVLGGALPARFLSKSEVGHWPLIGFLARQAGTVFIRRGGGKAAGVADELSEILAGGQSVMLFPEGTTSTGITVLPFHGRLLRAAQIAGTPIQPVSIVYRRGRALDHLAPFINDDEFLGHLRRLLRQPPPTVEILLHPPLIPRPDDKPSELAVALRATVLEGVNAITNGQPGVTPAGALPLLLHPSPRAFR